MENIFGGLIEFDTQKDFDNFVESLDKESAIKIIEVGINYALSNGLSGGQYTLVIAINIPNNTGVTYTFNGSGFSLTPKFNFTTITTGNVNVSTTRYIVLTFAYDGTNYFMSGSNFT